MESQFLNILNIEFKDVMVRFRVALTPILINIKNIQVIQLISI